MNYAQECKKNLVEIYENADKTSFYVGYFVEEDTHWAKFHIFDKQGFDDGYIILFKDDIRKIEKQSKYLNNLELGIKENAKAGVKDLFLSSLKLAKTPKADNLIVANLQLARRKKLPVVINLIRDDLTQIEGYIKNIDLDNLTLKIQGLDKSINYINLEYLESVHIGRLSQRLLLVSILE